MYYLEYVLIFSAELTFDWF